MEPNLDFEENTSALDNAILEFRKAFFIPAASNNLFQPIADPPSPEYVTFQFSPNCEILANQKLLINPISVYIVGIYINNKHYFFKPKSYPTIHIPSCSTLFKKQPPTTKLFVMMPLNPLQQSKTATKQSSKIPTKDCNFLPINLSYSGYTSKKADLHTFNKAMIQLFGDLSIGTTKQQLSFEILLLFVIEPARNETLRTLLLKKLSQSHGSIELSVIKDIAQHWDRGKGPKDTLGQQELDEAYVKLEPKQQLKFFTKHIDCPI